MPAHEIVLWCEITHLNLSTGQKTQRCMRNCFLFYRKYSSLQVVWKWANCLNFAWLFHFWSNVGLEK